MFAKSFPYDPDFTKSELISASEGHPVGLYSGYSESRARPVVYKVIEDTPKNAVNVNSVAREATIMQGMKSPNICEVMELKWIEVPSQGKTYCCIVMERLDKDWSNEIGEKRKTGTKYEESVLWERLFVLISTLADLQTHQIAHRDIKPQNILLTNGLPPRIKLADFDSSKAQFDLFTLKTLQGTVPYLSPKLYDAYKRNMPNIAHNVFKSDVYSLAVTIVHAGHLSISEAGIRGPRRSEAIDSLPYSEKLKTTLKMMLEEQEEDRPDFIQLAEILAVIPSRLVPFPYLNLHPNCPKCGRKCGSAPFIQFPCMHILAYCSVICLEGSVIECRQQGYVGCICGQRYRYSDFEAAIPRLRTMYIE